MRNPLNEGGALWLWLGAALLSCLPFLLPLYNPDLFWHLSAGRWMVEHGRLVREDFLSYTMQGAPWADFEWLSQVFYYGVHALGGMAGLWLLKAALMAVSAAVLVGTLRLHGVPGPALAAAVVAWSAGNLPRADLRPDQFSVIGFGLLYLGVERVRLQRRRVGPRGIAAAFVGFALWTNFHAGCLFGFLLLACCVLAAAAERRWSEAITLAGVAAAAFLGTLVNPSGVGPYLVMLEHWWSRADLSRHIQEWSATTFSNRFHQPFWAILLAFLAVVVVRLRSAPWAASHIRPRHLASGGRPRQGASRPATARHPARFPSGPVLAALALGLGAVRHVRVGAFFVPLGVALIFQVAHEAGWLAAARASKALLAAGLCYAVFLGWGIAPRLVWPGFFDGRFVPVAAAEFVAEERKAFEGLRLYNPWEWGGYLGWRLGPWHKVFDDGRYIFHGHLPEIGEAVKSVEKTKDYVDKQGFDGLFLRNIKSWFATRKAYRDGSTKRFLRPWYLFTFPKERWALVYWDEAALLFVDRRKAPVQWLAEHEYRWVRPFDDDAFAEALERKEIPADKVAIERRRHDEEVARLRATRL
ncbi:MAG: hypothetical protein HY748_04175 [Elusimicrobia bacterium]|nr:hypothetical protein [Elusimicrobiota bacterium]